MANRHSSATALCASTGRFQWRWYPHLIVSTIFLLSSSLMARTPSQNHHSHPVTSTPSSRSPSYAQTSSLSSSQYISAHHHSRQSLIAIPNANPEAPINATFHLSFLSLAPSHRNSIRSLASHSCTMNVESEMKP